MAKRRAYKNQPAQAVAQLAWDRFTAKIPSMIQNYGAAMNKVANSPESADRYVRGVSTWITVMRQPQVRMAIANAVAQAKMQYRAMRQGIAVEAGYSTVPATVRA